MASRVMKQQITHHILLVSMHAQNEDDLEVGYDSEEDLQNLIEFDRMEVDEILEMVRRDVSVVKQLEAQAPQAVKV